MHSPPHDDAPHADHEHGSHDHGGGHGEDFPRVELAAMVGEAQASEDRRRWAQWVVMGLGLGALCLGLPTARYFESMDWLWRLTGSGPAPHGLLGAPVLGLSVLAGWSLETSAYFMSAAFLVASFFALQRLLGTLQIGHGLAITSATLAVFTPVVALGATLPIGYTAGLLGATCLAHSLFRTKQAHPFGYLWRASIWLAVSFFLSAENIWLICPALWAVVERPGQREQGWLRAFGLLSTFAVVLAVHLNMQGDPAGTLREALFLGGIAAPFEFQSIVFWVLGLGVLWWGVLRLFVGRHEPEESPAPTWTLVWAAVSIAPLLAGGPSYGPTAGFLVPIAAVGLAASWNRMESVRTSRLWSLAAITTQALLCLILVGIWRSDGEQRAWLRRASQTLEPTDGLISDSRDHAYLGAFRLGVPTLWLEGERVIHARSHGEDSQPTRWALDHRQGDLEDFERRARKQLDQEQVQWLWLPSGSAAP